MDEHAYATRLRPRQNFLAGMLARNCKKDVMPMHHVLLGIDAKQSMVNRTFWDKTAMRILPCYNWN